MQVRVTFSAGRPSRAPDLVVGTTAAHAAPPGQAPARLGLKVTNLAGKPASYVQVVLMNTDNAQLAPAPLSVTGAAPVSVPPGDYRLFALFFDKDAAGNVVAFHRVFRSDFRVAKAGATVTIPERSATSPISVSTPRQAGPPPARGSG